MTPERLKIVMIGQIMLLIGLGGLFYLVPKAIDYQRDNNIIKIAVTEDNKEFKVYDVKKVLDRGTPIYGFFGIGVSTSNQYSFIAKDNKRYTFDLTKVQIEEFTYQDLHKDNKREEGGVK